MIFAKKLEFSRSRLVISLAMKQANMKQITASSISANVKMGFLGMEWN
jgi:hypothetical protein